MAKQSVSLFSFVMGLNQFTVLNIFELLNFRLDDGVSSIRVDGLCFYFGFDFCFSFLVEILICSDTWFRLDDLSCQDVRDLSREVLEGGILS